MFKMILDIRSMDYNAIFDGAMEQMKNNPNAPIWAKGKIPSKMESFLFKRMTTEQKNTAAAEAINQKKDELIPMLQQAISRVCYVHITNVEARTGTSPDVSLRFFIDVAEADYDRAADFLTGRILQEPDIPEALGEHYHTGIHSSNVRQAIIALPVPEKELVLLRILRINRYTVLRAIETGARMKNIDISFGEVRFMVPR